MLLPIKPETPQSAVFAALNNELLNFLNSCINATSFRKTMLSPLLRDALWNNEPTRIMFRKLWNEIKVLSTDQRQEIKEDFERCQNIECYFSDTNIALPSFPTNVEQALGNLAKHLFERTSKLAEIEMSCGEREDCFLNGFREHNKNVCCACATESILPKDHLLNQKHYPALAVNPKNIMPICTTCNSRTAKGEKNIILNNGIRRRCFYPYYECAEEFVFLEINRIEMTFKTVVNMHGNDAIINEKLQTWDDIYNIKSRVEAEFSTNLLEKVDADCRASDLNDFKNRIRSGATHLATNQGKRSGPMYFWLGKLYSWLQNQSDDFKRDIWAAIQSKRDDPAYLTEYER